MSNSETTTYEDSGRAPFIYFDIPSAHGVMNNIVQVELACRVIVPDPNGPLDIKIRTTGHLRCSAVAAAQLRDALTAALKMLDAEQQKPTASVATGPLN